MHFIMKRTDIIRKTGKCCINAEIYACHIRFYNNCENGNFLKMCERGL